MSQLPLFEDATQLHPPVRSRRAEAQIICPPQPRSKHPKRPPQSPLLTPFAATAQSIAAPFAPEIDRSLPPDPPPAKELPPGWVDPSDPAFNYLKNCRLCGAPISIGGLDHSLCSGDCGYVVDLIWQAQQQHRKRGFASVAQSKEPQAATHAIEDNDFATLDLFNDELEGGEA